jgi:hypothetical protein
MVRMALTTAILEVTTVVTLGATAPALAVVVALDVTLIVGEELVLTSNDYSGMFLSNPPLSLSLFSLFPFSLLSLLSLSSLSWALPE